MRLRIWLPMEMYDINYMIAYGDVWDYLYDCLLRSMRLITWFVMELYEINYLIALGDVWG